jgi:hypothetical protein
MKIMVGIDLHSNNALCGLMDESGRRLVHKQLPCDLATILQLLDPYKDRIATIAVESTFNWYWLVDGLQDHGYHVEKVSVPAIVECGLTLAACSERLGAWRANNECNMRGRSIT